MQLKKRKLAESGLQQRTSRTRSTNTNTHTHKHLSWRSERWLAECYVFIANFIFIYYILLYLFSIFPLFMVAVKTFS